MLLSAVSVLVVTQSSSEIPEGLMNNPVYIYIYIYIYKVNQSHYRPEVPRWFQVINVPRFGDNGTGWW